MTTTRSAPGWHFTLLLVGLAGCASTLPDPDRNAAAQAALFVEDRDPQMARLDFAADELLIRTLPGAADAELAAALARAEVTLIEALPEIQTVVAHVAPARQVAAAESLAAEPILEAIQKNYYFDAQRAPDDPRYADQTPLALIGLPAAWEISTGSDRVLVAVLDTGVFTGHPDLTGRTLAGRNTFDRTADSSDAFGHGTAVAGVLGAASDNGTGVAGVNWESQILAVRVANADGRASTSAIAAGIVWAVNRGARVINVSFAPLQTDAVVLRAARHAFASGALVFIAAGNDGLASTARGTREAVFVGATDDDDQLALFSSTGPFVDLVAPGVALWSTTVDGDYTAVSGTSFASPLAAGVAALIWSAQPDLHPVTVERILRDTAVDLGAPGRDPAYGAGRIDAASALAAARDILEAEDHRAPSITITSPLNDTEVSGTVRISADAADLDEGLGVAEVTLYVDGAPLITDTAAPYTFALATQRMAPGDHTLGAVATDDAGNSSLPAEINVRIRGAVPGDGGSTDGIAPQVTIQFPLDGAVVSGQVGIQAVVTDNVALQTVELLVDGTVRQAKNAAGTRATVAFTWSAAGASAGDHVITIRAADAAGNRAAASVTVSRR